MSWDTNTINIVGASGIILEFIGFMVLAWHLARKERNKLDVLGNDNSDKAKYCKEDSPYYPKRPYWPRPHTVRNTAYSVTECKTSHNCNKVFHLLAGIINKLIGCVNQNRGEPTLPSKTIQSLSGVYLAGC